MTELELQAPPPAHLRLAHETGRLAGRLLRWLEQALPDEPEVLGAGVEFLRSASAAAAARSDLPRAAGPEHPLERLSVGFGLTRVERDLILFAGMSEEHEGYSELLRNLHPGRIPRPTVGLAAQILCGPDLDRPGLRSLLERGRAREAGILRLEGKAPFFERELLLAEDLWAVLSGVDRWPGALAITREGAQSAGLDGWLASSAARAAAAMLASGEPRSLLVTAHDPQTAANRARALLERCGLASVTLRLPTDPSPELESSLAVHAAARGCVPVVVVEHEAKDPTPVVPEFADVPVPLVLAARTGAAGVRGARPIHALHCERLDPRSLRRMWSRLLPEFTPGIDTLAARYPVEPHLAAHVLQDLPPASRSDGDAPSLLDIGRAVRVRAGARLSSGMRLVRPRARWADLILPERAGRQLREAVARVRLQSRVFDDWRFLENRAGARGVRLLLSGPPGTGKSLSAEVLASELDADSVLSVDLSQVVSKWVGETEKNLAEVFDAAERSHAVLLIDEADSLFGKRTEITDAHDRYANLETAYLLTRLESFDGLAILTSNLRKNIDPAFLRRLEFHVEFNEPGLRERVALWRVHLPDGAPLGADVDLQELAARYPVVGGLIRNAAVAAAFLAAEAGTAIERAHLIHALRREYEKSGKAFPGLPPNMPETTSGVRRR